MKPPHHPFAHPTEKHCSHHKLSSGECGKLPVKKQKVGKSYQISTHGCSSFQTLYPGGSLGLFEKERRDFLSWSACAPHPFIQCVFNVIEPLTHTGHQCARVWSPLLSAKDPGVERAQALLSIEELGRAFGGPSAKPSHCCMLALVYFPSVP